MCDVISIKIIYSMYERVCRLVESIGGTVSGCTYAEDIEISVVLPCTVTENFLQELKRIGNGKITPLPIDKIYT